MGAGELPDRSEGVGAPGFCHLIKAQSGRERKEEHPAQAHWGHKGTWVEPGHAQGAMDLSLQIGRFQVQTLTEHSQSVRKKDGDGAGRCVCAHLHWRGSARETPFKSLISPAGVV